MGDSTQHERKRKYRSAAAVAVLLSLVAGFVDIVGYLALDQILLANMSGNTLRTAQKLDESQFFEALRRFWPIVAFLSGVIFSAWLHELGVRRNFRAIRYALAMQVALLLLFAQLGEPRLVDGKIPDDNVAWYFGLVAIGGVAMGLQNASITRVGPVGIFTTHVTGTLVKFCENLVQSGYWFSEHRREPGWLRRGFREKCILETLLMAALWLAFLLGAIAGGLAKTRWGLWSLLLPVLVLPLVIVWDILRPIEGDPAKPK